MYLREQYGFYIYNQIKTCSKLEIMQIAENVTDVKWNYNDEYFSAFDWTKEPSESLSELYRKRAQQLRIEYDYIILMYSGGADSGNILETFLRNNIELNEVVHLINYEGSQDKMSFQNREIFLIAKPKIEKLIGEKKLQTKSRVVDITKRTIDFFKSNSDFIYWTHSHGAPNMHAKTRIYQEVKEWRDMISNGKKVCFLWGCDKPRVLCKDDKYYFHFTDVIDGAISVNEQAIGYDGAVDELFYWAPKYESTRIMIKQAHIIKRFLSNQTNRNILKIKKRKNNEEVIATYNNDVYLFGNIAKSLLYPHWNPADEINLKSPTGNFLSSRDEWFWKNSNDETVNRFLKNIEYVAKSIKQPWLQHTIEHNNKLYPKKITKMKSRLYALQ